MSTDMQKYSIANQEASIARYAECYGMRVVRTYRDDGKSGLRLRGRTGLQTLMRDVLDESRGFNAVLVYDISRWGRFQDTDESAHYEFLCKRAGAPIVYCAESFPNSAGPMVAVLKSIKRSMAAEYSRELAVKVRVGQCRLAKLGYFRGGVTNFGMARKLLSDGVEDSGLLRIGQHKALNNDRVVLTAGAKWEVAVVRLIFNLYVTERLGTLAISRRLNALGIRTRRGAQWTSLHVVRILANEVYVGTLLYNRTTRPLGENATSNPPEEWIRGEMPSAVPVISRDIFDAAQRITAIKAAKSTEEHRLDVLRELYRTEGKVTLRIVKACTNAPHYKWYYRRFGSMPAACRAAGIPPAPLQPPKRPRAGPGRRSAHQSA
jgi:DNA invertase Pin-like site-specific DNA recombinase